jgi:carbamoyl-phosphate synthase large subunit
MLLWKPLKGWAVQRQFAHDPKTDRVVIIEINPRRLVRRNGFQSTGSDCHGFTLLAAGLTLDEIPYCEGSTLDKYNIRVTMW